METVQTAKVRIQRRTMPSYETEDFYEAVHLWRDWRTFGFPFAGGMMDQPAFWLDIVRLMQECGEIMKVE